MRIIRTPQIPEAGGHYSMCTEHAGVLYVSGQLPPRDEAGGLPVGIVAQTEAVLKRLGLILREAGSDYNHVLQVRIYIPDVSLWDQVNEVYARFFTEHKPARCVVPTRTLHYGSLIEVECTAVIKEPS